MQTRTRTILRWRPAAAATWRGLCAPAAAPKSRWQRLRAERRAAPPPKNRTPADPSVARPDGAAGLGEAVRYVRAAAWAGFDESVEVAIRLGIDARVATQMVRTHAVLPHGHGIKRRVAVLDEGAWEPDADCFVGGPGLLDEVVATKGRALRGVALAIAPSVSAGEVAKRAGRLLGPRGLLPNAKEGTVVRDVAAAAHKAAARWVRLKADSAGTVHAAVGKVSMDPLHIEENILVVVRKLMDARPAAIKRNYLCGAVISSTMGPGVRLNLELLARQARLLKAGSETM